MSSRILPEFDLLVPQSIPEAVEMLGKFQNKTAVMAGGTDLLVLMKAGLESDYVMSLSEIPGLDYVIYDPQEGLRVGAMATLAQVVENADVKKYYPALWQSACVNGTPQTRNKATVVGNILRASPAGDCCVAALALGGRLSCRVRPASGKSISIIFGWLIGKRHGRRSSLRWNTRFPQMSGNPHLKG